MTTDRLDMIIDMMRKQAPPEHVIHTADIADLRIAVAHLCDRAQMGEFDK